MNNVLFLQDRITKNSVAVKKTWQGQEKSKIILFFVEYYLSLAQKKLKENYLQLFGTLIY